MAATLPLPDDLTDNSLDDMDDMEDDDEFFEEYSGALQRLTAEFGSSLYGTPNAETGEKVKSWKNNSAINPEELGEYAEGDILFPPTRNGIRQLSARWPDGVVYYQLAPGFSQRDLVMISNAINAYHTHTCIRFLPYTGAERDYLYVTHDNTGCWSAVGRTGGPQQLNLQSPGCTTTLGTIIHEFMHAIGFLHEQNRYERDSYVIINWQNIQSGRELNFNKASEQTTYAFGVPYDYGSVMHYSGNAFSNNGRPTITSKNPNVQLGQRDGFSQGDVQKINGMYKNICGRRSKALKEKVDTL
ncbi:hatching enzyme 1.2-like [Anabrus simplex]|uniref:hatching enzyme 1.2-like n=1 Tax=Anabrus simplex TaxID=316456 RepID=UPI0035A31F66